MQNFKLLDLTQIEEWKNYLNIIPTEKKDIYFTPEYYKLYEDLNDGQAKCYVFEKNGAVAMYPFLLNSVNKLGYELDKTYFDIQGAYGYNGVISSTEDPGFLSEFNNAFTCFCTANFIIAEFTRFHPLLNNYIFSKDFLTILPDRVTVFVDLTKKYSQIFSDSYSSQNRNMISKANKRGYIIEIVQPHEVEKLDKFIEIYYYNMDAVNAEKYYFFPRQYFLNMFELLKDNIYLLNVKDGNNEVICSAIFFHFNNYFHYHLSGRAKNSDNSINNYLLDNAIIIAIKKKAELFHLGGGRSSDIDDSLLKFKKNFSKSTANFFIGKRILNSEIYNAVVKQWENKFPEKKENYRNFLLKYRY